MSRAARAWALAAASGASVAVLAAASGASAAPASLTVETASGGTAAAATALGRSGLRVQRRLGTRLQVVADPARARSLSRLPGVTGVREATTAYGDLAPPARAMSQGLARTGADILGRSANGGAGLVIAILDLGFGSGIEALQRAGELPPPARLGTVSFDAASGLAGTNAYGNRTNHGELVAQTVYDYAPRARYIFANYHSEADFVAAVEHLITLRPDIVVHSNSFIEGPFDGTGMLAQAVDRAAAAGILWFNSAGNYARQHWNGPWADADGDRVLDWADPAWTFARSADQPVTFHLSWINEASAPTDLDLLLQRRDEATGSWDTVASSRDRQAAGAAPAERIVNYRSPIPGEFRLRVVHAGGPVPARPLTVFLREIALAAAGGSTVSSLPTPGDAVGAIAVGAVDWRGDHLKPYSSQGPSDDGRLKPDIVAPTGTRVLSRGAMRGVGGTSNAAPNAAGAAAVLIATERRAGRRPDAAAVRAMLAERAVDLGDPGPDMQFGVGRVRVSLLGPRVTSVLPVPRSVVRGVIRARFAVTSESTLTRWSLMLDGERVAGRLANRPGTARIDTRLLPDGQHRLTAEVRDYPGNRGGRTWTVRVDNTAPTVVVRAVRVGPPRPPAGEGARRPVTVRLAVADPGVRGPVAVDARLVGRSGRLVERVQVRRAQGTSRTVALPGVPRGRHTLRVRVTDAAGNVTTAPPRRVVVR